LIPGAKPQRIGLLNEWLSKKLNGITDEELGTTDIKNY
jgi:hypothetical protein